MQVAERREVREYKEQIPLEARMQKVAELRSQRPGHCPLILLKARACSYTPPPQKYCVDGGLQVGTFLYTVRKQMTLKKSDGLYMYVGDMLPVLTASIGEVYREHADLDGFLYLVFSHEADKGVD